MGILLCYRVAGVDIELALAEESHSVSPAVSTLIRTGFKAL